MGNVGEGYAQNDEHLRNMEKEAYLQGNMCFRDWEDGYKRSMMESIHRQNSFKRRNTTMKKYNTNKNNELNKLLMEKFNLGKSTLNEVHCSGNRDDEEEKETMEESHCMGQGKRGDKPCPECGKKVCAGKGGNKKVEEKKFPDLTGDGKVTQADILKGKGVDLDDEVEKEKNESFRHQVRNLMEEILKIK